jgi:hypothetical protein
MFRWIFVVFGLTRREEAAAESRGPDTCGTTHVFSQSPQKKVCSPKRSVTLTMVDDWQAGHRSVRAEPVPFAATIGHSVPIEKVFVTSNNG